MKGSLSFAGLILLCAVTVHGQAAAAAPLRLEVFVADTNSYCVTSTLITGTTEAILVDVQFRLSEAAKLADRVAASGKRLKAIFISHPDVDHYLCMALWKERFPATPIYMTAAALSVFQRKGMREFRAMKMNFPAETPDSLPTPELLTAERFTVDGEEVNVVADVQGDTWNPSNSYLWIPSLRAVVAGDLVFNGVHVWLANSTRNSRAEWLSSLKRMDILHPAVVIAGHKRDAQTPDIPDALAETRRYIKAFDDEAENATGSDDLSATMRHLFRDWILPGILARSARVAIPD